mmetsp:Transcript_183/g.317  ORF Transcript_183/g.317 Transcript_183/m.317 type:complete len:233 (+) Transcript_183:617-1315(+)
MWAIYRLSYVLSIDKQVKSAAIKVELKQEMKKHKNSDIVNMRSWSERSLGAKISKESPVVSDDQNHKPPLFNPSIVDNTPLQDSCEESFSNELHVGSKMSSVNVRRNISDNVFSGDDISSLSFSDESGYLGHSTGNVYIWEFINETSLNDLEGLVGSFSIEQDHNDYDVRDNLIVNGKVRSASSTLLQDCKGGQMEYDFRKICSFASTSSTEIVHLMDEHWGSVNTHKSSMV